MNLTLNKVVRPWGAGKNLNDFRNFLKKRQASDMPKKKILKVAIATQKRVNLHVRRPTLFWSAWLNKRFKLNV